MINELKYEELILKKFAQFKYKPRKGQVELINQILVTYIDKRKKYVILSASTGTGKSLVGLIVSECLNEILRGSKAPTSYIVAHTNTLLKQYDMSYNDSFDMIRVMGRNNYDCAVMLGSAENCIMSKGNKVLLQFCGDCEYARIKREMKQSTHILTNYAYLFTIARSVKDVQRRLITIFDEAHLLNDQFVSHLQITFTEEILLKIYDFLREVDFPEKDIIKTIFACAKNIKEKKIPEHNHEKFIKGMKKMFDEISDFLACEMEFALKSEDKKTYVKLNKKLSFFQEYTRKIEEFLTSTKIEYVVDIKPNLFEISPIFIQDSFKDIEFSEKFLFMSATLDVEYLNKTMKIPPNEMEFIQAPPIFDKENKTVVFCNSGFFNYSKMNDDSFLNEINKQILTILKEHTDEKGIILTTNFKHAKFIGDFLKTNIDMNVMVHNFKTPLKNQLEKFKEEERPSVLLSPSIFEGVDLPDDESRFQIFVKAPYYSLGSKRIQYIAQNYPEIYQKITLYRIIQGAGRSTRSEEDWCVNYFLDSHLMKLFFGSHNLWENEFEIIGGK